MKIETLLKDPVFQLNLLIWMTKDQPKESYRVRPLFHIHGFEIIYIEMPFPFPEQTASDLIQSGLDISHEPEPEMILGRKSDYRALYIEAKANSFGTSSIKNCRQARAHLVASGPAFGEVFTPYDSCLLCYVTPNQARSNMSECLSALTEELRAKALPIGPFSAHGLARDGTKVVYSWDQAFKSHVGIREDSVPILDEVADDTDPSPLILVFSGEDCSNDSLRDFYRRIVIEQVHVCLHCTLHSHPVGVVYEITADKLLENTSDGIFQFIGRDQQRELRLLVNENILKHIHREWNQRHPGVAFLGNRLSIQWNNTGEKDAFLDWLEDRHTRFNATKPPEKEPSLFDIQNVDGPSETHPPA
jgi:hypothetical protein